MNSSHEAETDSKYAIYFDISDVALKSNYPYKQENHSESTYKNAYRDIAKYLNAAGFIRQQGSGYVSTKEISYSKALTVIERLAQKMPWLTNCFERLDLTIAGKSHDLTNFYKSQVNAIQEEIVNRRAFNYKKQISNTKRKSSNKSKKQRVINFDINQNLLKVNYPYSSKIHNPYAYKKAYGIIANYLESVGFSHRQFSGYLSDKKITIAKAEGVVEGLAKKIPWLINCVTNIELTTVSKTYDMTKIFKMHAQEHLKNKEQESQKSIGIGIHHKRTSNENIIS